MRVTSRTVRVALAGVICFGLVTSSTAEQLAPDPKTERFFVSPSGNDGWSGRLAAPNAAATDGPVATLAKARDLVRGLKAGGGLTKPVEVILRGGFYALSKPLEFAPADSGTEACPVTYRAYPGEKPVISGGRTLGPWQLVDGVNGKLWKMSLPDAKTGGTWQFNALFVNGERRVRARIPNKGSFLRTDGPTAKGDSRGFYFHKGDVQEWDNLRDVLFVAYHSWETSLHHVRDVDTEANIVTFREPAPWPMGRWERHQRYYVENVFEGLDEPGEWYLNRTTGTLHYYPRPGEKPDQVETVAPVVTSTLIRLAGDPEKGEYVEHLHFRGLSFQHTNADLRRIRNPGQGEIYQPAMIMAVGLRHSSIQGCEVAHTGAHALWMASGCEDNRVQQCHLHDLNGGGVYLGGGWGVNEAKPVQRIVVDNNFIHDGGHLFHGAHGVWIGRSSYNGVTHNEISNFDYSGISCGWSWGFQPSSANHNNLDYNHIHHLSNGEGLSDMGAIYTLGVSPGTTERYNHCHDIFNYANVSHGSGLYPDEGSSEILMENNVVYRVRTCPLFMHYGADCIVRNNVLAFGGEGQLRRCREDKRCHYAAEGNIVYGDVPEMLVGPWKNGDWKVGRNVYWSTAGAPTFAGMDFETWQVFGKAEGSIVADPLFVDPQAGDFRLQPNSPALKLGFKPIDLSNTGLQGDPAWVNLPQQYPNRPRNDIPPPVEPPFVINFDFEGDEADFEPLDGTVVLDKPHGAVVVSDDTAAAGKLSLKFVDAPGQKWSWAPHLYYYPKPEYETGKVQVSWDMLNSKDAPASFYVEVRDYRNGNPYLVGPAVSVTPEGQVTASGQDLGAIPLGEWAHVDLSLELGPDAPKTYRLKLTVPGADPRVATVPFRNDTFKTLTWLGVSSTSDADTVFYLDNLKLGTAEQLAQPPKRHPRRQARQRGPRPPANDQQLMGAWNFDGQDGYLAVDSSGYGNDGDMMAEWVKGAFGGALLCTPAANSVTIRDDPSLQFGASDFSIELWICPTQLAIAEDDARRRFMDKTDFPRTWWNMNITAEGTPFLEMTNAEGQRCVNKPSGRLPEGAWTHLVVVVDRANAETRYYFNGALDSAQKIPPTFTGPLDVDGADLSLGSTWHPFIGLLDEVKIYKRVLTPAEIKASHDKEKANRTSAAFELVG